ncbi:DUF21-domain-containing protein [Acaromyces ingoldii]|uniref:DUF21-domain-containing protein n=1 Tax=Acaromyces ingoldii TaxID=215250 RepID=A0A316YX82_9BASI|nr:DUF21-domain-containing protein [Acaromyces ingoldii]PWN92405.1 DUF21-domain-containing protein [Acaromyces ingoldii]
MSFTPGAGASTGTTRVAFAKLALVCTTAVGHALAAPLFPGSGDVGATRASHRPQEPQEPRTVGQLVVDCLSIAALVLGGGLCAGLTLSLMGLDSVNLQVLSTAGSETEKRNATKVLRLLERGRHWVLVVLLLSNVIVNEALPIFLSDFGGPAAVLTSTVLIVIFGEVLPQSICARYGLSIGAACAPFVWALMVILAPIAWPTAKLLDYSLGEDHGTTYKKAELKTFVSLHQQLGTENLNEDEVTIIRAVLDLNDKTVRDVMTPIADVFTLSGDTILNEEGVEKLVQSGYSRVPIYEKGKPDSIMGMLLVKDLITYDPEDGKMVSSFQLRPLPETGADMTLLSTLNYFQTGRSHMLLVSEHPGEPKGALGVVTLEDVVEELIGEEIIDETDVWVDVHNRIRVSRKPNEPAGGADLGPLVRGIIERRRLGGLKQRAPLRASFAGQGQGQGAAGKGVQDRVLIKRPTSPSSRSQSGATSGDGGFDRTLSWSSTNSPLSKSENLSRSHDEMMRSRSSTPTQQYFSTSSSDNKNAPHQPSMQPSLLDEEIREDPQVEAEADQGERKPLLDKRRRKNGQA